MRAAEAPIGHDAELALRRVEDVQRNGLGECHGESSLKKLKTIQ